MHDKGAFASCTCAVLLNRHHHLSEVETHRSVPLPFRSDQPFGRYSRKKAKNEDCANRHVPSATDRFLIGTIIFPRSKHIDQCLSLLRFRLARSDIIREKAKNKDCANRNRHVPSTTDHLSTGTVIFPMSKHINYCLSQSDRTSRSDDIREKAKNKVCQSSCAKWPPIDSQWAPSSSRGRITSISASPIPIGPAVRTLFVKRLKIRIVPIAIGMCQVPPTDSQEAPSSSRGRHTD